VHFGRSTGTRRVDQDDVFFINTSLSLVVSVGTMTKFSDRNVVREEVGIV